jgi:hypothetical protein
MTAPPSERVCPINFSSDALDSERTVATLNGAKAFAAVGKVDDKWQAASGVQIGEHRPYRFLFRSGK